MHMDVPLKQRSEMRKQQEIDTEYLSGRMRLLLCLLSFEWRNQRLQINLRPHGQDYRKKIIASTPAYPMSLPLPRRQAPERAALQIAAPEPTGSGRACRKSHVHQP